MTRRETGVDGPLDMAAKRLERALATLEGRMVGLQSSADAGGLFDHDRSKLAAELDAARARERELQAAGQEAALALDRAIAEVREVLSAARGDDAIDDEPDSDAIELEA
jgi:hypothetical protein